jgi:hypothetical protein
MTKLGAHDEIRWNDGTYPTNLRRRGWTGDATITNCVMNTKIWFKNSFSTEQFSKNFYLKILKVEKYFNGKIFWNRFTGPIKSECFAAVRITCSKCRECSAKTVASVGINCWRKSAFLFGNIGLCVPEPISNQIKSNQTFIFLFIL